ncbi:hypothetical protein BYT27DRAFT_7244561 [Phlegmacium glaucopus]|nr:hypothetical protein BYT27DRAFT_7244561 [Phlegmacium glaucopus]
MSQHGESSSSSFTRPSATVPSTPEISETQRQVVDKCTSIVQDFRSGKISKPKASVLLQQSIPHDNASEDVFLSTYEPYFDMLENFERYRRGNVGRIDSVQQRLASSLPDGQDDACEQQALETQSVGASKRPRSPESTDEDDEYARRIRLDFKSLPWNVSKGADRNAASFLSPSLQKTQSLLENFSRDVNQPIPQFPQAEWLNLLGGNAIDLDHVFSNIYTVSYKTKDTIELGKNVELLHDTSAPAKTVRTHGDWVIAWDCMVDAVLFVFGHRRQELQLYGKHIQRYFASLPSQLHSRVINYDRAVRLRAAQRRDLELSNFAEFSDLQIQWVHNPSNLVSNQLSEPRPRQSSNRRRSAACRRWNENRCPNTAASCNYLHVCAKCSSGNHVASDCSSNKK